jgi:hypothetical protein
MAMRSFVNCGSKSYGKEVFAAVAAVVALGLALPARGQTNLSGAMPGGPVASPAPTTAPAPGVTITAVQPFVGAITADRVYVRPAPGTNYYQLVQLKKDDTVQVVGTGMGWYQIVPPAGVYCLIAKEYVDADADGKTGTINRDYINIRAGSTLNPNRSDVVLALARKGTKLVLQGPIDVNSTKFYKIAPPEKTYVYVSAQFVKPTGGAVVVPPPHATTAPGTQATTREAFIDIGPGAVAATEPAGVATTQTVATTGMAPTTGSTLVIEVPASEPARVVVVAPVPTTTYAAGAYEKYVDLNKRTVAEAKKPPMQQDAGGLLEEWNALAKTENLAPSIKQVAEARITELNKVVAWQKLAKDAKADDGFDAKIKESQEAQKGIEKLTAADTSGPPLAFGTLETSTVVVGRYALVNPITRRVVAYVDPSSELMLEKSLGQYIGVRGTYVSPKDADMKVIRVSNYTVLPSPKLGGGEGGAGTPKN